MSRLKEAFIRLRDTMIRLRRGGRGKDQTEGLCLEVNENGACEGVGYHQEGGGQVVGSGGGEGCLGGV